MESSPRWGVASCWQKLLLVMLFVALLAIPLVRFCDVLVMLFVAFLAIVLVMFYDVLVILFVTLLAILLVMCW